MNKISVLWMCSQWRSQPKNLGGAKMCDFRRITLFCLENRLSNQLLMLGLFFRADAGCLMRIAHLWN